jgi:hypothetical protein
MLTPEMFAEQVYFDHATGGDPNKEKPVFVDPATIMMLTSVTIQVIKCILERRQARKAAEAQAIPESTLKEVAYDIKNPSVFDKITLKRVILGAVGFRKYRKEGKSILESLLRTGSNLTLEDIANLMYQGK